MKTLYLLRHGQASWPSGLLGDFNRQLDTVGERQAVAIGLRLAQAETKPEMIIASPADRTRQTARFVANALSYPERQIHHLPEIYDADLQILARIVEKYPASLNCLLMVGHNPTLSYFGEWLTGEFNGHLDPCDLLAIGFDTEKWSEIGRGQGRLLWQSKSSR